MLEDKKIKYECLDNYSGDRNECLIELGRILDFIGMPEKNEKLIEVIKLFINEEIDGRELLLEYLAEVPTEDVFYPRTGVISTKNMPEGLISKQAWKNFVELKELLIDFLEFPFNLIEKLVLYIAEKLNFSKENMAIAQKVASTVRFLAEDNPRYKVVNQVVYSKDGKTLVMYNCTKLDNSFIVPNTVERIDDCAFDNAQRLEYVIISNGIKEIGEMAFSGCDKLTSVVIPNSITEIGSSAFEYCENLNNISFPNGLKEIPAHSFTGSGISNLVIPNSFA